MSQLKSASPMTQFELWQKILQQALPGTAQMQRMTNQTVEASAESLVGQALKSIFSVEQAPECNLLEQIAAACVLQRVGAWPQVIPAIQIACAEPDTQVICPDSLITLWQDLNLHVSQARFKPDWRLLRREVLASLVQKQWRFPHSHLPELLELGNEAGSEDPGLRLLILPLLGQRGLWLAAGEATLHAVRNPWKWVFDPADYLGDSETALTWPADLSASQAYLILLCLRQQAPVRAQQLLDTLWPKSADVFQAEISDADGTSAFTSSVKQKKLPSSTLLNGVSQTLAIPLPANLRKAILPALQTDLSLQDEAILERCLDDKSRDVRQEAQALLGRLVGSQFVARMQARTLPLLKLSLNRKGQQELSLQLPNWPTSESESQLWLRDGLEKPGFVSSGSRYLVLEMMLKYCHPDAWLQQLDLSKQQLISLILASDDAKHLISGLVGAILNFHDQAMAAVFLQYPTLWQQGNLAQLMPLSIIAVLSPAQQQAHYLKALSQISPGVIPLQAWSTRRDGQAVDALFLDDYLNTLNQTLSLLQLHELSPADWIESYRQAADPQRQHAISEDRVLKEISAFLTPYLLPPPFLILGLPANVLPRLLAFCEQTLAPLVDVYLESTDRVMFIELSHLLRLRYDLHRQLTEALKP